METNKNFEFNFSELQLMYNALKSDIRVEKEKLSELEDIRLERNEDSTTATTEEVAIQDYIKNLEKLKVKINNIVQNF